MSQLLFSSVTPQLLTNLQVRPTYLRCLHRAYSQCRLTYWNVFRTVYIQI